MFQEFRTEQDTCLFDNCYFLFGFMHKLYFLRFIVFSKALFDASVSCHNYANN